MPQQKFTGQTKAKDALLNMLQPNDTELYAKDAELEQRDTSIEAEIIAARDGEPSLLVKEQQQDNSIAALVSGSGVKVSANDKTVRDLDTKLIMGEGLERVINNPGQDESMTMSITSYLKRSYLL